MVAAQTANITIDSVCIVPLLNAVAKAHVRQRQPEESDCDYDE